MALEINSVIKTPRSLTIIGTGALLFVLVGYFFIKFDKKQQKSSSSSSSSSKKSVEAKQEVVKESKESSSSDLADLEIQQSLKSFAESVVNVDYEQAEEMAKNKKVAKTVSSSSTPIDDQMVPTITTSQPAEVNDQTPVVTKSESEDKAPIEPSTNESVVLVPEVVGKNESSEEKIEKKVENNTESSSSSNVPEVKNNTPVETTTSQQVTKSKSKKKNKSENASVSTPTQSPATVQSNTTSDNVVTKPSSTTTTTTTTPAVSKKANKMKKSETVVFSAKTSVDTKSSTTSEGGLPYEDIVVYEFNFPRRLCGKLIGRNGVHVDQIRAKTHTQIAVRNDPTTDDLQIVCVSGRVEEVDQALETITQRFPAKIYPDISFKPISKPIKYRRSKTMDMLMGGGGSDMTTTTTQNGSSDIDGKVFVAPQSMFVDLMNVMPHTIKTESGGETTCKRTANTDDDADLAEMAINIHVTSVVNTGHVFIQVPSNPMYENLEKLDVAMLNAYSVLDDEKEIPLLREPIEFGTICAAPTSYGWHRAMVVDYSPSEETNESSNCGLATIKFLDYGGYLTLPTNQLRQLRSDFMLLPFQAIECYLDGIFPYEDKLDKGKSFLYNLIKNSVIKAVLTGYAEDGLPLLTLFITNELYQNNNLNNELIKYDFAYSVASSQQQQQNDSSFAEKSFSLSDHPEQSHHHMSMLANEQTIH